MQRHEIDPLSLVAGLVFVLVGGGYALSHGGGVNLRWIALLPAGLIVVGATILAIVFKRIQPDGPVEPPADV
ncbi:MAG: hypothetical protein JO246_05875 [Frankiaceae bacterium]|nr:hypothetical protein [Frankiaceae bacterium]MBV9870143.1 hypothetical protein [Frankiaceae bacterium]